jgi:hypothetical protein
MRDEDSRRRAAWHVDEDDLRAYARGELAAPLLWSADTHLTACAPCRAVLAGVSDAAALDAGWERLDAELDAPRPGWFEGLLVRCGVDDGTARLLAATPVLRRSWLGAVVTVLLTTFVVAFSAGAAGRPTLFLALAPLLPLAGVALAYGPALDPTYEMAVVAPLHGFRLLMIRTVAVLVVALGTGALASLALPGFELSALAWLLPGLALTASGLALTPRRRRSARAVHRRRAGRLRCRGGGGRRAAAAGARPVRHRGARCRVTSPFFSFLVSFVYGSTV